MGYTIENKQEAVVQSILLTTEQTFAAAKSLDQLFPASTAESKTSEIYFQIED
jgi:hypothetical protein